MTQPVVSPFFYALVMQGAAADMPSATTLWEGVLYWATDSSTFYYNDGSAWNAIAGGGGGGGTWPTYSGSGSPVGVQSAAAIGDTYVDTTNGAVWVASATGSDGWLSVGGYVPDGGIPGIQLDAHASAIWEVYDTGASTSGLGVQSAASGGTSGPAVFTNFNTLDDGNDGTATFQADLILPGLPTSDPHVVGAMWNSSGTAKISAG
jgi:hypothetical protein